MYSHQQSQQKKSNTSHMELWFQANDLLYCVYDVSSRSGKCVGVQSFMSNNPREALVTMDSMTIEFAQENMAQLFMKDEAERLKLIGKEFTQLKTFGDEMLAVQSEHSDFQILCSLRSGIMVKRLTCGFNAEGLDMSLVLETIESLLEQGLKDLQRATQ